MHSNGSGMFGMVFFFFFAMLYGPLPHNWLDAAAAKLKFTWPRRHCYISYNSNHIWGLGGRLLNCLAKCKDPKNGKKGNEISSHLPS